jgi:hypothetical protein
MYDKKHPSQQSDVFMTSKQQNIECIDNKSYSSRNKNLYKKQVQLTEILSALAQVIDVAKVMVNLSLYSIN